jgi:hypothetical protein
VCRGLHGADLRSPPRREGTVEGRFRDAIQACGILHDQSTFMAAWWQGHQAAVQIDERFRRDLFGGHPSPLDRCGGGWRAGVAAGGPDRHAARA